VSNTNYPPADHQDRFHAQTLQFLAEAKEKTPYSLDTEIGEELENARSDKLVTHLKS
jgi:hypothetical protein